MGYLDSLAGGLRAAAGIMSPEIQKQTAEEDQRNNLLRAQQQQFLLQSLQRQVESGAMAPDQATQALQNVGLNVPAQVVGGPSLEAQARKQALDNDMGFRQAVAASGGDLSKIAGHAAQFGKMELAVNIYNQQENRIARIQEARDKAEQRIQELQLRMEDRAATREQQQQYQQGLLALKAQSNALQAQLAQGNQELRRMQISMTTDKQERARLEAEDKAIEAHIGKTADRMKDIAPVMTASRQLNNLLSAYTPDTVPGVGYAKNTDAGKLFLSDAGKDVSSSQKMVGNSILKMLSGQAVTAPEEIRQMAATMADGRYSASDFYMAWPKVSEWINEQVAIATAGLTPKARERFIERTGVKLDPIKPRFTVKNENGKVTFEDSQKIPAPPDGFVVR